MADTSQDTSIVTVEDYLKGKVGYDIPDSAVTSILIDRGVEAGQDVNDLEVKSRQLCLADLYMYCSTLPSKSATIRDADGSWSHQEGGSEISAYDRRMMIRNARLIYKKYGENVETSDSTIKLTTSGFRLWQAE